MSFFADYQKEAFGHTVLENENGFVLFYVIPETKICYIDTIYVKPDKRRSHEATWYEKHVIEWAKEQGCTGLMGSVNTKLSTPERSMLMLLNSGYKFSHTLGDVLYFVKGLENL